MSRPYDLAVAGLGPAGRALAHRAAAAGLRVLAVDPHPERPWRQTLGGWSRQLPGWVPPDAVGTRSRPVLRTPTQRGMYDDYLVLDNDRLQRHLALDGVSVYRSLLDEAGLRDLARSATVVVDARGVRPAGAPRPHVPAQTAFGLVLDPERAQPALDGAQAVLMDWHPHHGGPSWGQERPTFLYVLPLPGGGVLVEETSLAGCPPMPLRALRERLVERLRGLGVRPLGGRETAERVHIDLARTGRASAWRFGAAGAQLNPVSGYSVFASLAAADALVARIPAGRGLGSDRPSPVRRLALGALLRLSGDDTVALFDAFSRLHAGRQAAILDADTAVAAQVASMGRQWWLMPPAARAALVAATAASGLLAARGAAFLS